MKLLPRLALLLLALAALPVAAAPINIELFGAVTGAVPSVTFQSGDQAVTVTAARGPQARDVFVTPVASGVAGGASAGIDAGESLFLDFSPAPVQLLRSVVLDFALPERLGVDFSVFADGVKVDDFNAGPGVRVIDLGGISGDVFTFRGLAGDAFYVRSVIVQQVTAPGTLALLAFGAAALGAARHRRR